MTFLTQEPAANFDKLPVRSTFLNAFLRIFHRSNLRHSVASTAPDKLEKIVRANAYREEARQRVNRILL